MKGLRGFFENLFTGGREMAAGSADRARPVPPDPEAAYRKGDIIGGKYEVHRLLGRGGFGEVYLVYSLEIQDACALKTFRQEFLADEEVRAGFKREALVWVKLDLHPFILAAQSVQELSGRLFVAMDYIAPDDRGRVSLADHLASSGGPLDTDLVLTWAVQFCHGMEHANKRGIRCHRDIKPANILIRQDSTLLISDFGLAFAAEAASKATAAFCESVGEEDGFSMGLFETAGTKVCGTPGYMAPEVFRGEGADVRSDIYSFGSVLWQMASGSRVPPSALRVTRGKGPLDAKRYIREIYRQQTTECPPAVGEPFEPVLGRCLAAAPSQRYGSFRELRTELEGLLYRRTGRRVEVQTQYVWSVPYWTNKGNSLQTLGRYDEAIAYYKKAVEIGSQEKDPEPDAATPPEVTAAVPLAHHGLALALYAKGEVDGAIAEFRTAIRLRPNDAKAHSNLGTALKAKGDLDGAISEWRVALSLEPEMAGAHANLGGALHDRGDLAAAMAEYRTAIRLQPDLALAHHLLGDALQSQRDVEGAINEYRAAIGIQPDLALAHCNLGVALEAKGDLNGAIAEYRTAVRLQPNLAGAHVKLGDALQEQRRLDEAIAEYRTAIHLQPSHADAHCNLGIALAAKGDLDGAISEYRVAIELQPRNGEAHSNLGMVLQDKGHLEGAISEYRTAVRLQPNLAQAHYNLGTALKAKGDPAGAIDEYRAAIRLQPNWAMAHYNLGNALFDRYDIEAAIAEYRTALRLQPDLTAAQTNLETALLALQIVSGRNR